MPIYYKAKKNYYYKQLANGNVKRVSKEEYTKGKKGPKMSTNESNCKKKLNTKIAINLMEYKEKKYYQNPDQAIAVAYNQVTKKNPKCKKYFKK